MRTKHQAWVPIPLFIIPLFLITCSLNETNNTNKTISIKTLYIQQQKCKMISLCCEVEFYDVSYYSSYYRLFQMLCLDIPLTTPVAIFKDLSARRSSRTSAQVGDYSCETIYFVNIINLLTQIYWLKKMMNENTLLYRFKTKKRFAYLLLTF